MDYFLQQMINGLTLGSIYGLIAIGYTMVYGIIGMINFSHGDVFMLSTFVALIVLLLISSVFGAVALALALVLVLIAGMALTSLWSFVIERVAYRPLRGSFRLAPLISAIGMSIFLSNFVQVTQGPNNRSVEPLLRGYITVPLGDGSFTVAYKQMLIFFVTAVLLAGFWFVVPEDAARAGHARVRAGPQDGIPARHRRRPDDLSHLRHGSGAGRGRRRHVPRAI